MPGSLRQQALVVVVLVGSVILVTGSGVLNKQASVLVDDIAQLTGGVAAAITCFWTAARSTGPGRRWRQLMGVGMAGWSVGMVFWGVYRSFLQTPLPSPSLADVGFFALPVMALPALLTLTGVSPRQAAIGSRHLWAIWMIDSLVVVCSLFVITWMTALGAVVRAGAPTTLGFLIAVGYPVLDYLGITVLTLVWVTGRVPPQFRVQLALLGSGIVAVALSDSVFAYLVASGAQEMPTITDAGFVAGPALIALAAAARHGSGRPDDPRRTAAIERTTLALPYLLVGGIWTLITAQLVAMAEVGPVELVIGWVVLVLVLVRQVLTLLENNALVHRISQTQAELTHQAHHDSLTGLANRALFDARLRRATERHRDERRPVALLLLDLDDFKAVNDRLGHGCGDELLRAVGARLRGAIRSVDTAARLGGDEFAVLLDPGPDDPYAIARRIHDRVQAGYELGGRTLVVGASAGLAQPEPHETEVTAETLLNRADLAMYDGKRRGKSLLVHYRPGLACAGDHAAERQIDMEPQLNWRPRTY